MFKNQKKSSSEIVIVEQSTFIVENNINRQKNNFRL